MRVTTQLPVRRLLAVAALALALATGAVVATSGGTTPQSLGVVGHG